VEELSSLPTLPGIVQYICQMVDNENITAQEIGNIIAKDQVLSAKILRLVNSPIYGFPGRISSITHALVLLGFSVVKGLVLSTAVFENMASGAKGLWEHSLGTAVISRRIAKELNMRESEEIMVAGLLHDLGKVVLSFVAPEEYNRAVELARQNKWHISRSEKEVFGVDHTIVAGWLSTQWHLPERLSNTIQRHHNPSRDQKYPEITATVHLADILSRGMNYGYAGDDVMPELDHEAFNLLGLSYTQIDSILQSAEQEFMLGMSIFSEHQEN